jgi:hypothetical protein
MNDPEKAKTVHFDVFQNQILRTCTYTDSQPDGTPVQTGVLLENLFFTDDVYLCDPRIGVEPRPNDINAKIIIGITIAGFAFITIVFILIVGVIRCAVNFEAPYTLLVSKP